MNNYLKLITLLGENIGNKIKTATLINNYFVFNAFHGTFCKVSLVW